MELNILYFIQSLRSTSLDKIAVLIFNNFVGDKGQFWVYLSLACFLFKKTRKMGICMLLSYIISYFIGDNILKDLIARPRPSMVDESIELLIKRPSSYSCPSVHAALAFSVAYSMFLNNKPLGIAALVFASLIGFSRMYFFVHYLSDVVLGALIGLLIAFIINKLTQKILK